MPKINIYAAGGSALNIGSHFVKYRGKQNPGYAQLETYFMDTSKSNLNPNIPKELIYILDELDGSGKLRASNYTALSECSKEILHQFKPADLNIILHSCGGGTGATLGPILASELLARGENVVVMAVGSTASRIETENTAKTLKSYEVISNKREMPVLVHYRENSSDKTRSQVDADIQMAIMILTTLFSGSNRELDMADLKNFINYNRVTTYHPKLSALEFFSKEILLGKGQALVSLATLVDEKVSSEVNVPVEYQAVGFIPDVTREAFSVPLPIHSCVIANYFGEIIHRLDLKINTYNEHRQTVNEKSIVSKDIRSTDDGLVL